jgi:hypothetical protein
VSDLSLRDWIRFLNEHGITLRRLILCDLIGWHDKRVVTNPETTLAPGVTFVVDGFSVDCARCGRHLLGWPT